MKKRLTILLVVMVFLLAACTNEQPSRSSEPKITSQETEVKTATKKADAVQKENVETDEIPAKLEEPVEIALVMQMTAGSFYTTQIKGIQEQVAAFGGEVKIYDSQNDLAKMASNIELAVTEQVDGILVSHGRADALNASIQRALDAEIPVVAFDSDIQLPGVTVLDQDDHLLAWKILRKIAEDLRGSGNLATIWVAGFAPMEKRQVMIEAFHGRFNHIKEVARFGSVTSNTPLDTQAQVEALLTKNPNEGEIDAIFSTWNEFTRGAVKALEHSGRTDVQLYGIDLTDEDLPLMQQEGSPLVAVATIDPAEVGRVQARLLYQKIGGVDVSDIVLMEPALVKKEDLPAEPVKLDELDEYVPGWGRTNLGVSPWMTKLEERVKQ